MISPLAKAVIITSNNNQKAQLKDKITFNWALNMEHRGFEPLTSTMRTLRATNCANAPYGLGERIRTSGLLNPIQARYQTALHPGDLFIIAWLRNLSMGNLQILRKSFEREENFRMNQSKREFRCCKSRTQWNACSMYSSGRVCFCGSQEMDRKTLLWNE